MIRVLKNEFIKMLSGKKFYALNILIIIAMVSDVLLMKKEEYMLKINIYNIFTQSIFGQAMRPLLPILMVVVVAEIFTEDYVGGTMKFTIISGVKRTEIVFAKLIFTAIYAAIFMAVTFVSSYITINIAFGAVSIERLFFDLKICAIILIPLISFSIVISFVAMIIKNSGIVIAVGTVIYIIMLSIDMNVKNAMYFSFSGGMYGYYFIRDYSIHAILTFIMTSFIYIVIFSIFDLVCINNQDILM